MKPHNIEEEKLEEIANIIEKHGGEVKRIDGEERFIDVEGKVGYITLCGDFKETKNKNRSAAEMNLIVSGIGNVYDEEGKIEEGNRIWFKKVENLKQK
jgi:hypothetical protein